MDEAVDPGVNGGNPAVQRGLLVRRPRRRTLPVQGQHDFRVAVGVFMRNG